MVKGDTYLYIRDYAQAIQALDMTGCPPSLIAGIRSELAGLMHECEMLAIDIDYEERLGLDTAEGEGRR